MEYADTKIQISDIVSQVYVIQSSGLVKLSRKYAEHCFDHEPQLVGAFIGALLTFIDKEAKYVENIGHQHHLNDIIMTCTRWIIEEYDDMFIIIGLHQNDLIEDNKDKFNSGGKLRNLLTDGIITAIDVVTSFQELTGGDIFSDFSSEFGGILDNMLYEAINSVLKDKAEFEVGRAVSHEDMVIFQGQT